MTHTPPLSYLLTIKEAAEQARLSEWFIKKEIREGRLLARKFGRKTLIERSQFERWVSCRDFAVSAPVGGGEPVESSNSQVRESKVSVR